MTKLNRGFLQVSVLIFAWFVAVSAQAQESGKDTTKRKWVEHQIGTNASNFILTFVSFNQGFVGNNNPYLVNYRGIYLFENGPLKGAGLRLGYGGANTSSTANDPINQMVSENKSSNRSWRIGVEVQRDLSERWMAYGGLDYIGASQTNISKTTQTVQGNELISENEIDIFSRGWGVALGTQFHLNKHLSLGTALRYTDMNSRTKRIFVNSNPSAVPQVTNTDSEMAQFFPPVFVNFLVRF